MLLLKWVLCAAFLSEIAIAPKLWTSERPFPTMPMYPWVPDLPSPICAAMAVCLVLSVLLVAIHPRPGRLALLPPAVGTAMAVSDMSRIQPWFYQYGLIFVGLAVAQWQDPHSQRNRLAWAVCSAVVIGVYLWSGLQKFNAIFADQVFPFLLHPLGPGLASELQPLWPIASIVETSVAILLLIPRTRAWGLGLAVAMHVFVLYALGPFGQNYDPIVWPWNFWITVLAFVLFFRNPLNVVAEAWSGALGRFVLVLMGFMPALSFFGLWDGFLSASFYSGKPCDGWIYLTGHAARQLPPAYINGNKGFVQESPDRYRLDILQWSMSGMNAPPYGEPRFYPGLVHRLEQAGVPQKEIVLVVQNPASLTTSERSTTEVPTN